MATVIAGFIGPYQLSPHAPVLPQAFFGLVHVESSIPATQTGSDWKVWPNRASFEADETEINGFHCSADQANPLALLQVVLGDFQAAVSAGKIPQIAPSAVMVTG